MRRSTPSISMLSSSTGMKEAHFTAWTPAGIIRRQEVHDLMFSLLRCPLLCPAAAQHPGRHPERAGDADEGADNRRQGRADLLRRRAR